MNLPPPTNTWRIDEVPETPLDLYKEENEANEVKESEVAKEENVGVCDVVVDVTPYILTEKGSNESLFGLAREIRGKEVEYGIKFSPKQIHNIIIKWEALSKTHLRPDHNYFTELLAKLDFVRIPKGATIQSALEKSRGKLPHAKIADLPMKDTFPLACLCRELHLMWKCAPFELDQKTVAKLFDRTQPTVCNWIHALKTVGLLKKEGNYIVGKRAITYRYCE